LQDTIGNIFFNWSDALPEGEIFATRTDSVNFYSVSCITPEQITQEESYLGQQSDDVDSVTNTFNEQNHPMFYLGGKKFENDTCISTNIYDDSGKDTQHFYELLLSDFDSNIIYTAIVDNNVNGFDNRTHDFEMIVGDNGHDGITSPTLYYFYVELQ
jgi:hypothetical protein